MTGDAGRRRPRRASGDIARLAWRTLENPFTPLEVLSADQVEAIHRASLRILAEIGVEVLGDRAFDLLARTDGAAVDRSSRRVRLEAGLVDASVALAPSSFRLHARNPARDVVLGGRSLVFCAVGGRPS